MAKQMWTIGHSTRPIEEFIALLQVYHIEMLVDIRTIPGSKHNPQYNAEALKQALEEAGIHYHHLAKLGGLRHTTKSSVNTGWHNTSFRGYADYMETPPFWEGIEELEKLAKKYKTCLMCAEAVPWHCHRTLLSDALVLCKWKVHHILSKTNTKSHELTPFLHIRKGFIIYADV